MILTIEQAIETFGVQVDEHLDRQASIPILDGLQFQGDVAVIPTAILKAKPATIPLPTGGFPVVRGEVGGNTHLLIADGKVFFDPATGGSQLNLGVLTVAKDATAYLAHPEHAYTGIAPGTYTLRRQREQADEIRMVQD